MCLLQTANWRATAKLELHTSLNIFLEDVPELYSIHHYIHNKGCFDIVYGGKDKLIIYCNWYELYSNLQLDQLKPKLSLEKDERVEAY